MLVVLMASLWGAGCGRQAVQPASPTATAAPIAPSSSSSEKAWLLRDGYTPDREIAVHAGAAIFHVFHSICTGSADGKCQEVEVFRAGSTKPVWRRQYSTVGGLHAVPGGFSVTAANYRKGDPLCCPSGGSVTDTYRWSGSIFVESGPTPGAP